MACLLFARSSAVWRAELGAPCLILTAPHPFASRELRVYACAVEVERPRPKSRLAKLGRGVDPVSKRRPTREML